MIKPSTVYRKIETLRRIIRAEGTPAIQDAWDQIEPHTSTFMNNGIRYETRRENDEDSQGSGDVGQP